MFTQEITHVISLGDYFSGFNETVKIRQRFSDGVFKNNSK